MLIMQFMLNLKENLEWHRKRIKVRRTGTGTGSES